MNIGPLSARQGFLPVEWLWKYLDERGLTFEYLCSQLNYDQAVVCPKSGFVSTEFYFDALSFSAKELSNPLIGADIALAIDPKSFGLMGYLFQHAPTLRVSFEFIQRYYRIFSWDAVWDFIYLSSTAKCVYRPICISETESREDIDFALMSIIRSCRELADDKWQPIRCSFSYSQPEDIGKHQRYFGDNLVFDQADNFIEVECGLVERVRDHADSSLLDILLQQADQLISELEDGEDITQKVHLLIIMSMGIHSITTDQVAMQLNMSVRKLHRQLARRKTSFKKIKEQAILEAAKDKLRTSDMSITNISQSLGYTEASSFDRAFKRLTGLTPGQYRHQHSRLV